MELPTNRFKHAIARGEVQIGLWCQLVSPIAAEVLAGAGFDFLVIDAEHAPNDVITVLPQLLAVDQTDTGAVVRMAWNDMVQAKRYLDIGAQTLLIPYVDNAEEAQAAVFAAHYPPKGGRGVAGTHRASGYGRIAGYFAKAGAEICVLAQVETESALGRLEEIAAVEGLDGIFIGPSDLSASMGHLGDPGHRDVQEAILSVPQRLSASGKPAGILMSDPDQARRYIEAGFVFVAVGSDLGLLARHSAELAAVFR